MCVDVQIESLFSLFGSLLAFRKHRGVPRPVSKWPEQCFELAVNNYFTTHVPG